MKASQKRASVESALNKTGKSVQNFFEAAHRAAHNGQLDQERVSRHVASYREEKGHPPGYVMDYAKRIIQSQAGQSARQSHPARPRHRTFATSTT
jgi:hypothetical protein